MSVFTNLSFVGRFLLIAVLTLGLATLLSQNASAQSDGELVLADNLTTPPSVASMQQAADLVRDSYPERLERRGIGGVVLLEFVVDESGRVEQNTVEIVTTSSTILADAAKSIVHRIRFRPGEVNGRQVRTQIQFPIEYKSAGS